jgi:hypothetical protein
MTRQELFELMNSDPEHHTFYHFDRLPEALKDEEVAGRWIEHVHYNMPGLSANHTFAAIADHRPELITDKIRFLAVGLCANTLHQISPDETPSYKEIALLAISKSPKGIHLLDKELHTPEMFREIFEKSPEKIDLWPKSHHWMRPMVTPEIKAALLETNLKFALSLDEQDVSRDQWRKLFTENPLGYGDIENRGRLHVLVDFVKDGGWLEPMPGCSWEQTDSLDEALRIFSDMGKNEPWRTLYKAKIHTFPIKDVMKATDHHSKIHDLIKLYPDAVLRKNIKHNRALRSYLLENDLGM